MEGITTNKKVESDYICRRNLVPPFLCPSRYTFPLLQTRINKGVSKITYFMLHILCNIFCVIKN